MTPAGAARYARRMEPDVRARRAACLRDHRWGLAFGMAVAATFATLPLRAPDEGVAADLLRFGALGAVWLAAGFALGAVASLWGRPREVLPVARRR